MYGRLKRHWRNVATSQGILSHAPAQDLQSRGWLLFVFFSFFFARARKCEGRFHFRLSSLRLQGEDSDSDRERFHPIGRERVIGETYFGASL